MKKVCTLLLVIALAVLLAACADDASTSGETYNSGSEVALEKSIDEGSGSSGERVISETVDELPDEAKEISSGTIYSLDDLGMEISIPSEYIVFTRDIDDNDPNLSVYGQDKNELLDLMWSRNIYLNAWDENSDCEIVVTMTDNTISDFNSLSDAILETMMSSIQSELANSGVTVAEYEVYQHEQVKFIKIFIEQPNGVDTAYGLQYYTVYDNKAVNITMQSYSGKIDSGKEAALKEIVDTVHFEKEPLLAESAPDAAAFLYKDKNSGIEFSVPANWTQEALSEDREFLNVKFTSNKEPGLSILFGSSDVWATISPSEKKGLSRADIDNSNISIDDLAETMGIEKSKMSTATYGGKEYYKYTTTSDTSAYGVNLEFTMTCFIRYENGYAYIFQFSGDDTNAFYNDFESLLESVKFQ